MAYQILNKDKKPVKQNGKDLWASDVLNVVKSVNMNERTLLIRGTDETQDRDKDIVLSSGWDFVNFKKNPVFLWGHDYFSVPLARISKIIKGKDKSHDFLMTFPTLGIHPYADMILALYNEKIINATSAGFLPKDWEDIEDKDNENNNNPFFRKGRKYKEQELLELSGCAIPCNPNAVQEMVHGKTFGGVKGIELFKVFSGQGELEVKNKDYILEELDCKCIVIDEKEEPKCSVVVPEKIVSAQTKVKDNIVIEIVENDNDLVMRTVEPIQKQGAVLSKKNKNNLKSAQDLIQQVIDSSEKESNPNDSLNEDDNKSIVTIQSQANQQPNEAKDNGLYAHILDPKLSVIKPQADNTGKHVDIVPTKKQYDAEIVSLLTKNLSELVLALQNRGG